MKNILLNILYLICFFPLAIYSQEGTIEGSISSNSDAVAFANVGLSGTKLGTAADVNGKFKLNNIPVGTYTVQISAVGYKHYKKTVTIESGKTITLNITLEETAT
ncbi:MAG: carboxypeptidase-like regulatory domain-containing protein, partial [Flavobacteriales bacterium]|nr:carboxypeptidase-like regulatory domain-containing protein [Flavobacteriales bacterium]